MSSVLNAVGYHRKSAWLMYESVNRMLPLLIQGRATLASSRDTTKKDFGKSDDGILEILKRICEVYGLGGKWVEPVIIHVCILTFIHHRTQRA